jgi:hypothetical protein
VQGLYGNIAKDTKKQKYQNLVTNIKKRPYLTAKTKNILHLHIFEKWTPWVIGLNGNITDSTKKQKSQNLVTNIKDTRPDFKN